MQAKGWKQAFYRYNVLISLNEVGGNPSGLEHAVEEFHDANLYRARHWPYEMLATATHDTSSAKTSRARINILSEFPDEWGREVSRVRINRPHRSIVDGEPIPDRIDEYRLCKSSSAPGTSPGSDRGQT